MARLDIKSEILAEGVHVIRPSGKLDVFSFVELRNYFNSLNYREKVLKLVVDLSGLECVTSSGWSMLLSSRKLLRLSGGELSICGLRPEMMRVYDSMKIQNLLPSSVTANGAIDLLNPKVLS